MVVTTRIKWNGSKVRLGGVGFNKYQMLELGTRGVNLLKDRVEHGLGADDARMPPLKKGYAITKTKKGLGNIRNLVYTGAMLADLTVRYADDKIVKVSLTQRLQRAKALANEKIASWLQWSPEDQRRITSLAEAIFRQNVEQFAVKLRRSFRKAA